MEVILTIATGISIVMMLGLVISSIATASQQH